jgi:hypothetical protein
MSWIEALTEEQEERFPEFVNRWIKIGLCTDPADRPRAEAAIRKMYRQGGLEPPKAIVWCGSPLSQGLTRAIILDRTLINKIGDSRWASEHASIWASVGDSVRASAEAGVGAIIGASVRDSVSYRVWESAYESVSRSMDANVYADVEASVQAHVRESVWERVAESVKASVESSAREIAPASVRAPVWRSVAVQDVDLGSVLGSVLDSVRGAHEAGWLAFYHYFHEVAGLTEETAELSGSWELAQSAGWVLPHQNICWVAERHNILARDYTGRLHCETGPACAYPDGWEIYARHGVRAPPM